MVLEWDKKALDFLVNGYDISYGARSIKHEVDRRVVNQIAVAHEYNLIGKGSKLLGVVCGPRPCLIASALRFFRLPRSHNRRAAFGSTGAIEPFEHGGTG